MKLANSLSIWLTVTSAAILSIHGLVQLRKEQADLKAAASRELTLMATVIRSSVEYAIRDGQQADIIALLNQIERRDPAVGVFIFDSDGVLLEGSPCCESNLAVAREVIRESAAKDMLEVEFRGSIMLAVGPMRVHGSETGSIVIIQPTDALVEDLRNERRALILSIAGLVLALSFVTWIVMHYRLHRPMNSVIKGIRRAAAGDLSSRLKSEGKNEVAELAGEFNAMTEALEEARCSLDEANELREQLRVDVQRANRMAAVGQLAASLAHEIGSPMQVLSGRARSLSRRSDLPDDVKRSAEILVEQTERVADIVERLLDVARVRSPYFAMVKPADPLMLMIELMETEARRMNVRLETNIEDVPAVRADPNQVKQVFFNLIQNACRACQGGGRVKVSLYPSSFLLPADLGEQESVAVTVEDTGPGVKAELREKIFSPFFTRWPSSNGFVSTGLGLAVVKAIVDDHGGRVCLEPGDKGSGARFTVHFIVKKAESSNSPEV